MPFKYKHWTVEEVVESYLLAEKQGMSYRKIAKILKRSRIAVTLRVWRIKQLVRGRSKPKGVLERLALAKIKSTIPEPKAQVIFIQWFKKIILKRSDFLTR